MLTIHLFLLAVEEYYSVWRTGNELFCDNKGAIFTFCKDRQRISAGSKNSDIQRVLRRVKSRLHNKPSTNHVKAHHDDFIDRKSPSLPAQLNCYCNDLAKRVVTAATLDSSFSSGNPPLESATLRIDGEKQTTDTTKGLRFHIGRRAARSFYDSENIMPPEVFDTVAWLDIQRTLQSRPRMYQLWYGKQ